MKRLSIIFVVSFSLLHALHFNLKYTLTDGPLDPWTVVRMADLDCDTKNELIFSAESLWMPVVYEFNGDSFVLVHSIPPQDSLYFWGVGDFDRDGLKDLLIVKYFQAGDSCHLLVYESDFSCCYPTQSVFEIPYPTHQIVSIFYTLIGDFDNDYLIEWTFPNRKSIYHYENVSNNLYRFVYEDTVLRSDEIDGNIANDLDHDGKVEFVYSDVDGRVFVFENAGNDRYILVRTDSLARGFPGLRFTAIYDNQYIGDMDGDGREEILLHGKFPYAPIYWRNDVFILEFIDDNRYEVVWYDSIWPDYSWPRGWLERSDAGDLDGDGDPELALSIGIGLYIMDATGDNSYDTLWSVDIAALSGVSPDAVWCGSAYICDIDNNRLNDIVFTLWGGDLQYRLFVFEKGIDMEWVYPTMPDTFLVDSVETLRWRGTCQEFCVGHFKYSPFVGHPRI